MKRIGTEWEEDYSHSDLILVMAQYNDGLEPTLFRKKSRAIVIADIALPPLIVHRFLFEP